MGLPEPRKRIDWSTYSALTLHRKCPQAWSYRYLYGLSRPYADDPKPEANMGNWWHALRAAESIERGLRMGTLKWWPETLKGADGAPRIEVGKHQEAQFTSGCEDKDCRDLEHWVFYPNLQEEVIAACRLWSSELSEEHQQMWKEKLGQQPIDRLLDMERRYQHQWGDKRQYEQPIAVEFKWVRDIPGSNVQLLGYVDEVFFDTSRNLTVVRDHKTSTRMSTQSTADDMMDSQLDFYAWGVGPWLKELNLPAVSAVAFDRVMSKKPTTPKLTPKTRKLSAQVTQYDELTYLDFVEATEGYEADQRVLDHITSPSWISNWFQRTLRPINRNLQRAHLQAAVDSNQDAQRSLERVLKRGEAPRNMTGSACKYCDFAKLCRAQMVGGPDGDYEPQDYGLRAKESKRESADVG